MEANPGTSNILWSEKNVITSDTDCEDSPFSSPVCDITLKSAGSWKSASQHGSMPCNSGSPGRIFLWVSPFCKYILKYVFSMGCLQLWSLRTTTFQPARVVSEEVKDNETIFWLWSKALCTSPSVFEQQCHSYLHLCQNVPKSFKYKITFLKPLPLFFRLISDPPPNSTWINLFWDVCASAPLWPTVTHNTLLCVGSQTRWRVKHNSRSM